MTTVIAPAAAACDTRAVSDRPIVDEQTLAQLATRFRHARRAALRYILEGTSGEESEGELLSRAWAESPESVERRVFDNALALGRRFASYYGDRWLLSDLPRVLPALGTPCADGVFSAPRGDPALLLLREPCRDAGIGCAYFREAIAGLVLGASGRTLLSRQSSQASGGERCVDVFHDDPQSPHAYGAIPDDLAEHLRSVQRQVKAFDSSAELTFLGINEGVLLYRLTRRGDGEMSLVGTIERGVHRRFPDVVLREISPRPVMD